MEFSRPEYWSVLPFPSPGDLPNPGIEPRSPTLQADSLPAEPPGKPFVNHTYQSKFKLSQALIWLGGLMLKFIHFFFPSSGDLPNPGIEPRSPTLQADALPSEPPVRRS